MRDTLGGGNTTISLQEGTLRTSLQATGVVWMLALLSPASLIAQQRPPEPLVEHDLCPFECCVYRQWTARDSIIVFDHEASSDTAFSLQPHDSFAALTGNVHLIRVGIVQMKEALTIFADDSFPPLRLAIGDSVYVLSALGEGWYDIWTAGRIRSVEGFWDDPSWHPRPTGRPGILLRQPQAVWWVHIKTPDGRMGWINMDHAFVSGADACG